MVDNKFTSLKLFSRNDYDYQWKIFFTILVLIIQNDLSLNDES